MGRRKGSTKISERAMLEAALDPTYGGSVSAASVALGLNRSSLGHWLRNNGYVMTPVHRSQVGKVASTVLGDFDERHGKRKSGQD